MPVSLAKPAQRHKGLLVQNPTLGSGLQQTVKQVYEKKGCSWHRSSLPSCARCEAARLPPQSAVPGTVSCLSSFSAIALSVPADPLYQMTRTTRIEFKGSVALLDNCSEEVVALLVDFVCFILRSHNKSAECEARPLVKGG